MDIKRDLTDQEEDIIYKAVDDFRDCGKTNIGCPICEGKLKYTGSISSFSVLCENCGEIYALRGI